MKLRWKDFDLRPDPTRGDGVESWGDYYARMIAILPSGRNVAPYITMDYGRVLAVLWHCHHPSDHDCLPGKCYTGLLWRNSPQGWDWWNALHQRLHADAHDPGARRTFARALICALGDVEIMVEGPKHSALASALTPTYFSHKTLPKRIEIRGGRTIVKECR